MKISGVGPGGSQDRRTAKTGKDKSAEFARALRRFTEEAQGAGGVRASDRPMQTGGLEGLLAAQMVDAPGDATEGGGRRHQALVDRGERILDQLEDLRLGLLTGRIPEDRLASLAQAVRDQREEATDPQLAAILDEIELRAEVELAKLSRR